MASQLNIKDAETIRLAQALASASGRTMTAVIRAALERENREREDLRSEKLRAVQALLADFWAKSPPEWRNVSSKEAMDSIYDDNQEDGFAR